MAVPRVEHKRTPLSFAGESGQDVADRPISEKHLRPWDAVTVARCGAAKSQPPNLKVNRGLGSPWFYNGRMTPEECWTGNRVVTTCSRTCGYNFSPGYQRASQSESHIFPRKPRLMIIRPLDCFFGKSLNAFWSDGIDPAEPLQCSTAKTHFGESIKHRHHRIHVRDRRERVNSERAFHHKPKRSHFVFGKARHLRIISYPRRWAGTLRAHPRSLDS